MAYTEFYCDPASGDNMNGGSDAGSPTVTYTNGGWNSGTGVFTPVASNPSSAGVTVGQFASVYADGSTTPAFVGRVTAVTSTNYTVSVTIKIGTVPTTAASGLSSKVGGAWKGPNGAVGWPVGNVAATLLNSSSHPPRVNMKNNATYAITAGLTQSQASVTFEGYTSSAGDGGKATIDGSTNQIVLFTLSGNQSVLKNLIFSNNGTAGTNIGLTVSGSQNVIVGCVMHDLRSAGSNASGTLNSYIECEAYNCNTANVSTSGGFVASINSSVTTFIRCIAHDNAGSGSAGFAVLGTSAILLLRDCIADTNEGYGFRATSSGSLYALNCDAYNNGTGFNVVANSASRVFLENCNILKNVSEGVIAHASGVNPSLVINCAFGAGTQANGTNVSGRTIQEIGSVTYASNVTPWIDPANGDFRINLAAAVGTGRGTFTQTAASYTGTSGSPVIGAAQVADYPAVADVANGETYANGAYTGTNVGGGGGGAGGGRVIGSSIIQGLGAV